MSLGRSFVDILILCHTSDVCMAIIETLESSTALGARIESLIVGSGMSAPELAVTIQQHNPKVVLYDMGPPPYDRGIAKWERVLKHPGTDRAYVLLTTNPFFKLDRTKCPRKCVHLMMPTDANELVKAISFALDPVQ